jgi:prephenate dehydrogenase
MINRLTIFGVGLIGGSLALALKRANYCRTVVGCSRSQANLLRAIELGVIDEWSLDPGDAVEGAEMILLAVPVGVMESVMSKIAGRISKDTILTDAGSSKASVVEAAENAFGSVPENFVPGHPIAGREKSGVDAAVADLFVAHKVILCPLEHNRPEAIAKVSAMWEAAGAQIETLGVQQHDQVLAATSHLPHVLAYSLVNTLAETEYVEEIFQFAAGGFRDFSRIASSDPVMWRDICLENRDAILAALNQYQANLDGLKNLIEQSKGDQLLDVFTRAKTVRDTNVIRHETRLE